MTPKEKGEVTEQATIAEFLKKGFFVSKPIGDSRPYDAIIDVGKLLKVQIKKARFMKTHIRCKLTRTRINTKRNYTVGYSRKDVHYFAFYCFENGKVYVIKNRRGQNKHSVSLRFDHPKTRNQNAYHKASDFELTKNSFSGTPRS